MLWRGLYNGSLSVGLGHHSGPRPMWELSHMLHVILPQRQVCRATTPVLNRFGMTASCFTNAGFCNTSLILSQKTNGS